MDYSEPLTRLEKLPSLISDCFRHGDKEGAYQYLEEVKERALELQAFVRMQDSPSLDRLRNLARVFRDAEGSQS